MDEAITTGISSHSLSAIPGILRHDGNPPLYYLLLHVWMSIFGTSESATHALSVVFGLLTIPAGMWAGWSLFGRRAGVHGRILFAFSAFLTQYAQETRMYELMGLLGIFATAGFLHGFVYRRRGYLIMFAVSLGADALHPVVGDLLLGGCGRSPDPGMAAQRRPPRAAARRDASRSSAPGFCTSRGCPTSSTRPPTRPHPGTPRRGSARRCSCRATCSAATGSRSRCCSRR